MLRSCCKVGILGRIFTRLTDCHICFTTHQLLLLWLRRQFSDQPVLRVTYWVSFWCASVYVTLAAHLLAAPVTVRQPVAQGGDDGWCVSISVNLIYAAAFPMCIYVSRAAD
jgi:hypothetical protein